MSVYACKHITNIEGRCISPNCCGIIPMVPPFPLPHPLRTRSSGYQGHRVVFAEQLRFLIRGALQQHHSICMCSVMRTCRYGSAHGLFDLCTQKCAHQDSCHSHSHAYLLQICVHMPLHNSRGDSPALLALPVPANRHLVLHNDSHRRSAPEDVQMLRVQMLRERPEQML